MTAHGVPRRVLVDPLDDAWALYDLAAEHWPAVDRWEWWL